MSTHFEDSVTLSSDEIDVIEVAVLKFARDQEKNSFDSVVASEALKKLSRVTSYADSRRIRISPL